MGIFPYRTRILLSWRHHLLLRSYWRRRTSTRSRHRWRGQEHWEVGLWMLSVGGILDVQSQHTTTRANTIASLASISKFPGRKSYTTFPRRRWQAGLRPCWALCFHPTNSESQIRQMPFKTSALSTTGISRVTIPSNVFIPREHSSHWQCACKCSTNVSSALLLNGDLVWDDWSN